MSDDTLLASDYATGLKHNSSDRMHPALDKSVHFEHDEPLTTKLTR